MGHCITIKSQGIGRHDNVVTNVKNKIMNTNYMNIFHNKHNFWSDAGKNLQHDLVAMTEDVAYTADNMIMNEEEEPLIGAV
jgi:hypothetical protein